MDALRDNDFRLVQDCQDPDSERFEEAFEALYTRYRDRVYSIAYRITGRTADAMDVMQESFSLLFRKIGSFRFDSRFSTWLYRIVVNCSIDHVRQERSRQVRRLSALPLDEAGSPEDDSEGPRESAESRELGAHVQACITKLSPKLRAILVLRYLEGLSYEELHEALGVSMGTVKSRLARAHAAMERILRGTMTPFGMPGLDEDPGEASDGEASEVVA